MGAPLSQRPREGSRRVARRVTLHKCATLDEYVEKLENNPAEVDDLYHDLLIGVTSFFRDPEAFQYLENQAIPLLFRSRSSRDPFRVWVPGCATGEEAYSVAILLKEAADAVGFGGKITIFATDVHRRSLDKAALGVSTSPFCPISPKTGSTPISFPRTFPACGCPRRFGAWWCSLRTT